MTEQAQVLLLGYGEMGKAMEKLIRPRHELTIWERHPSDGSTPLKPEKLAAQSDIIIFCLPVVPHRAIAKIISPALKSDCLCISIAKGLDENGHSAAKIFSDEFNSQQDYGVLYGPMISEEIQDNRFAFAQFGCNDIKSYKKVQSLFNETKLYIKHSPDITGISWSVILKNVYAIAFGLADELQLGDNVRGYLAVAALDELNKIAQLMGGQSGSPYELAGLGDLITTATSEDSHHHELGRKLAREETNDIKGEGIHTLKMVSQHNLFKTEDYPLYKMIEEIVLNPRQVKNKFSEHFKNVFAKL